MMVADIIFITILVPTGGGTAIPNPAGIFYYG